MQDQIYRFLSHLPPFAELPENELSRLAGEIVGGDFPEKRSTFRPG